MGWRPGVGSGPGIGCHSCAGKLRAEAAGQATSVTGAPTAVLVVVRQPPGTEIVPRGDAVQS
jgi:hypothetical protein